MRMSNTSLFKLRRLKPYEDQSFKIYGKELGMRSKEEGEPRMRRCYNLAKPNQIHLISHTAHAQSVNNPFAQVYNITKTVRFEENKEV